MGDCRRATHQGRLGPPASIRSVAGVRDRIRCTGSRAHAPAWEGPLGPAVAGRPRRRRPAPNSAARGRGLLAGGLGCQLRLGGRLQGRLGERLEPLAGGCAGSEAGELAKSTPSMPGSVPDPSSAGSGVGATSSVAASPASSRETASSGSGLGLGLGLGSSASRSGSGSGSGSGSSSGGSAEAVPRRSIASSNASNASSTRARSIRTGRERDRHAGDPEPIRDVDAAGPERARPCRRRTALVRRRRARPSQSTGPASLAGHQQLLVHVAAKEARAQHARQPPGAAPVEQPGQPNQRALVGEHWDDRELDADPIGLRLELADAVEHGALDRLDQHLEPTLRLRPHHRPDRRRAQPSARPLERPRRASREPGPRRGR